MNDRPWAPWQKIAFRFFFPFLTLQVLTENFLGNLFGNTLVIWNLGEKIFVPPCLWLNKNLFHFKYIPQSWTTFSGALHTIRDAAYLFLSLFICITWTLLDRKVNNYNRLNYWFSKCLIIGLSCICFSYGIIKVFPVQMMSPSFINLHKQVGQLTPFDLLWTTFGYGKPYQVFTGFFECLGAILILFKRTRVTGLLIILFLMINVIMLNYTYQVGVLITSVYISLIALFLLTPYIRPLFHFFFIRQIGFLYQNEYVPPENGKTKWLVLPAILLLGSSFYLTTRSAYNRYTKIQDMDRSREYSLVRNYIVNNDTVRLTNADTWNIWSERIVEGKRQVTIAMADPQQFKTYSIQRDSSIQRLTLRLPGQMDSLGLNFEYTKKENNYWSLDGMIKQDHIKIDLQRVRPDTLLNLLKEKRIVLIFDDVSDVE